MGGIRSTRTVRHAFARRAFLALSVLLLGCDKDAPGAPGAPVRPTFLTIDCGPGACQMDVGSDRTLTALAAFPDGSRRSEPAVWTTDNARVATVDNNGSVRGISSGATTIRASAGTLTAGLFIQVRPRLVGSWEGQFVSQSCKTTESFDAWWCADIYPAGSRIVFQLSLREENGRLSGWIGLTKSGGAVTVDEGGSFDADGRLRISARGDPYGGWMGPFLVILDPLEAQVRDVLLEGNFVLTVVGEPGSGINGSVVVEARLDGVTRR